MYLFLATTFLKTIPYSLKDPNGNLTLLLMAKDQHACERMAHEEDRQLTERDILASLTSRIVYLSYGSIKDPLRLHNFRRYHQDPRSPPLQY